MWLIKGIAGERSRAVAMGRQGSSGSVLPGRAQALPRGRLAAQHAAHVAVLVSKLALPTPPSIEGALWAIASCDTLKRAPKYPDDIPTKSLRETCEAV